MLHNFQPVYIQEGLRGVEKIGVMKNVVQVKQYLIHYK